MKSCLRLLAGSLLLTMAAAPALAGHSSPAEREATRQLNLQAAQSAKADNSASQIAAADNASMTPGSPPAAAPTTPIQSAAIPDDAAVILSSLQNPPSKVANANVLDINGQTIGAVQRVEITPEGTPTKIAIVLLGTDEKMVVLDASAVKYDSAKNQVLAQQSAAEIKSSPNAG